MAAGGHSPVKGRQMHLVRKEILLLRDCLPMGGCTVAVTAGDDDGRLAHGASPR